MTMQQHDIIDPFLTYLAQHSEYDEGDNRRAIEQLSVRQGLIQDWLDGNEYVDAVLDCIEEHGLNAAGYVDAVTDHIDQIVRDGGTVYLTNETGILLPSYV